MSHQSRNPPMVTKKQTTSTTIAIQQPNAQQTSGIYPGSQPSLESQARQYAEYQQYCQQQLPATSMMNPSAPQTPMMVPTTAAQQYAQYAQYYQQQQAYQQQLQQYQQQQQQYMAMIAATTPLRPPIPPPGYPPMMGYFPTYPGIPPPIPPFLPPRLPLPPALGARPLVPTTLAKTTTTTTTITKHPSRYKIDNRYDKKKTDFLADAPPSDYIKVVPVLSKDPNADSSGINTNYHCELCNIICAGQLSIMNHIGGLKHKKLLELKKIRGAYSQNESGNNDHQTSGHGVTKDKEPLTFRDASINLKENSVQARIVKEAKLEAAGGYQESDNKKVKTVTSSSIVLLCKACLVPCVSIDSYLSHLKGQKHHRSLKVKKILNEFKRSPMPEIVSQNVPTSLLNKIIEMFGRADLSSVVIMDQQAKVQESSADQERSLMPPPSSPNILPPSGTVIPVPVSKPAPTTTIVRSSSTNRRYEGKYEENIENDDDYDDDDDDYIGDVKPIGQDFIDEVLNQTGKLVCYTCTLCECRFNDANSKNLHLKGKRHRLQYKKKVDPNLIVDFIKSDKKIIEQEKMLKEQKEKEEKILEQSGALSVHYSEDIDPFESVDSNKLFLQLCFTPKKILSQKVQKKFTKSFCDILLDFKHLKICPTKAKLNYIHLAVNLVEKAIRTVARFIELNFLIPIPIPGIKSVTRFIMDLQSIEKLLESGLENLYANDGKSGDFVRILRPGTLGQGLVLNDDKIFDIMILTSIIPTRCLLTIFERFVPEEITKLAADKSHCPEDFHVQSTLNIDECRFEIFLCPDGLSDEDKLLCFHVYITCPYIRGVSMEVLRNETTDLLNIDKCLESLKKIRQFRWVKENINPYYTLNFVVRIVRELIGRVKTLSPMPLWCYQVILERIWVSTKTPLTPSTLFRHLFEFLSCGIFTLCGGGLIDPCEKNCEDLFRDLTLQQQEDLIYSAQHTLRMIALREMKNVLHVSSDDVEKIRNRQTEGKPLSFVDRYLKKKLLLSEAKQQPKVPQNLQPNLKPQLSFEPQPSTSRGIVQPHPKGFKRKMPSTPTEKPKSEHLQPGPSWRGFGSSSSGSSRSSTPGRYSKKQRR